MENFISLPLTPWWEGLKTHQHLGTYILLLGVLKNTRRKDDKARTCLKFFDLGLLRVRTAISDASMKAQRWRETRIFTSDRPCKGDASVTRRGKEVGRTCL